MHSLKSSSAIVGATDFSAVCAQVEQCAREGKVDLATSLAKELLEAAKMLPGALLGANSYK